jgi:hypothetical protein
MGTVMLFGLAVPVIELVIGVIGLLVILGMAGFATWLAFFGQRTFDNIAYPVKVPGWGMRLAEPPPFKSSVEDVARMNALLLKHAMAKGYKKRAVKKTLNESKVRWVKADPQFLGKRAVVDPWNRRVPVKNGDGTVKIGPDGKPETKPLLVAGWHQGKTLYVVFVPEDVIEKTAYAHEGGHGVHLIKNISDYEHADEEMWGPEGIVVLVKNEMHKERTGEDPVEPLDNGIEVKS